MHQIITPSIPSFPSRYKPSRQKEQSFQKERLVWAEIDLKKFEKNFLTIKNQLKPGVKFAGVLKANAYGHGITQMGKEFERLGADYLAVTCIYEGRKLREAGVKLPILLIGYTNPESISLALEYKLTISVSDEEVVQEIIKQAKERHILAYIHLCVDTGMRMAGTSPQNALHLLKNIQKESSIFLEGIFSHFADAEAEDLSFAYRQLQIFTALIHEIKKLGIYPPLVHMANGAAIIRIPEAHFTMVRPGTFLYGPQTGEQIPGFNFESIMTIKTLISHVRTLDPGDSVGYGQNFNTAQQKTIATIPVGYGDGFQKKWQYVLIHGQKAPIISGVAMDQTAIDVSHIPDVKRGDEVVLLGKQNAEEITINALAQKLGVPNYEVLSGITERVTRIYKR